MERQTDSSNWRATARFVEGMTQLQGFRVAHDWAQLDSATHKFAEAIKIDTGYKAARFYLGVSEELIGRHDVAVLQFEELRLQTEQPDIELLYNLGLAYFHQYNAASYRSSLTCLNKVVELTKNFPPSTPSKPESEKEKRRLATIRLLSQAVSAQVHSHFSIPPKGVSKEEALEHFQDALRIATTALEEFDTSRNSLEQDLVPDIGWGLHNAIGHAYLYAGRKEGNSEQFEMAISEFDRALQFDPDNYRVLGNLGSAHLFLAERMEGEQKQTQLDHAQKTFHRVLQLRPDYDFAYVRLAQIALERSDPDEAKRFASLAKQHRSEMPEDYLSDLFQEIRDESPPSNGRIRNILPEE